MTTEGKRVLRAAVVAGTGRVKPPPCPRHTVPMTFHPERMVWMCDEDGCQMVAYPKADLDRGKPIVSIGKPTLLIYESDPPRYFLRGDNNIMVEITECFHLYDQVEGSLILSGLGPPEFVYP